MMVVDLILECDYEETIGVDSKKGLSKAEKIYQIDLEIALWSLVLQF